MISDRPKILPTDWFRLSVCSEEGGPTVRVYIPLEDTVEALTSSEFAFQTVVLELSVHTITVTFWSSVKDHLENLRLASFFRTTVIPVDAQKPYLESWIDLPRTQTLKLLKRLGSSGWRTEQKTASIQRRKLEIYLEGPRKHKSSGFVKK